MTKREFLKELEYRLAGLPESDLEERLEFYSEMIDDRMEEGKSEEEAVSDIGTIDEVVSDIANDTSLVKLVSKKMKPKRSLRGWEIALLILGFPLWFPLVMTTLALLLVLYILIWVLVIVTYSVELALVASALYGLVAFFTLLFNEGFNVGYLGITLLAFGLGILFLYVCKEATVLTIKMTKSILLKIKRSIIGKGKKDE